MIFFISSVRRGLEEERDALPGLISALGHEARRFEDFTALPVPPRQACLEGVDACDVYLLLLGERYGEPIPDTGLSPTEEEFTVARRRGIPVVVFRKAGVSMEPAQDGFAKRVEAYAAGFFRNSFATTAELLTKVAGAIRALEQGPAPLKTRPLENPLPVDWLAGLRQSAALQFGSALEFHLIPVSQTRISAGELESIGESLVRRGREQGLFSQMERLESRCDGTYTWAEGQRSGLRVDRNGEVTAWRPLPRDTMGVVIDQRQLEDDLAGLVRLAGDLGANRSSEVALAVALDPLEMMAVEGDAAELGRRTRATLPSMPSNNPVRVDPEEAIASSSLAAASADLAHELALRLIHGFRKR
jgi:Domain of unknown function (DUF4062)